MPAILFVVVQTAGIQSSLPTCQSFLPCKISFQFFSRWLKSSVCCHENRSASVKEGIQD